MHNGLYYIAIVGYFIIFHWKTITNPYRLACSEALDTDFPTFLLVGRCAKTLRPPYDPFYFRHIPCIRASSLFPLQTLLSIPASLLRLDTAWWLYTAWLLTSHVLTTITSYHLFGTGLVGLFGALAWGFCAYHQKHTLWYTNTFLWITITLLCITKGSWLWGGISLGMLILSGHPPLVAYFCLFIVWVQPAIFPLGILVGSSQLYAYYYHKKVSTASTYTYKEKTSVGSLPLWVYNTLWLPIKYRGYISGCEQKEWDYYVTPLVCLLAFYNTNLWLPIIALTSVLLSLGGGVFKLFNKLMFRFPQRWGYFAMLSVIAMSVNGLRNLQLTSTQLVLLIILLMVCLLPNRKLLPHYPYAQWSRRPSYFFNTPLLAYLRGTKVNNLPYPVYTGQVNGIYTQGYTGGNHDKHLGKFLNIPKQGIAPYNWFDWLPDGDDVDSFGIQYHIGTKPSEDPKWVTTPFNNLWRNTNV